MEDATERFGQSKDDLFEGVVVEEFNYSDYFDAIRKQFAENAAARQQGFGFLTGSGFDDKLVQELTSFDESLGKDEFFCTHLLDVILYGTTYFSEKVRLDFIDAFEKLRAAHGHRNLHVVCHSLGTAVVHDALAKYYRTDSTPFDNIPDLKTGEYNIASLWTLANVSRLLNILNGLENLLASTVQEGPLGCTTQFFNVRHKYDPFTWFKTYERDPGSQTFEFDDIRKVNTHDFYEYVTNPTVTMSLLKVILDKQVTDQEFATGQAKYEETSVGGGAPTAFSSRHVVHGPP